MIGDRAWYPPLGARTELGRDSVDETLVDAWRFEWKGGVSALVEAYCPDTLGLLDCVSKGIEIERRSLVMNTSLDGLSRLDLRGTKEGLRKADVFVFDDSAPSRLLASVRWRPDHSPLMAV